MVIAGRPDHGGRGNPASAEAGFLTCLHVRARCTLGLRRSVSVFLRGSVSVNIVRTIVLMAAVLFVTGCGGGGGTPGDARDPEKTSDAEQMADETDSELAGDGQ